MMQSQSQSQSQPQQPPPRELAETPTPTTPAPAPAPTTATTPTPTPARASSAEPSAPWSLRYRDGSNNATSFSRASAASDVLLEYEPMTPERSSSGTYSGGAPRTGVVPPAQVASLWERVRRLEDDPEQRAEQRRMGTGAFTISTPEGERAFLVTSGKPLLAFDAFLRPLQGR